MPIYKAATAPRKAAMAPMPRATGVAAAFVLWELRVVVATVGRCVIVAEVTVALAVWLMCVVVVVLTAMLLPALKAEQSESPTD